MKLLYISMTDIALICFESYHGEKEFWADCEGVEDKTRKKGELIV